MDAGGEEMCVSDELSKEMFHRGVLAAAEGGGCEEEE